MSLAVSLFAIAASVGAKTLDAGPADYRARLAVLAPGDTLRLAPGDYVQGLPIHRLNGRPGAPIRIEAKDRAARPRFLGRRGHNTVSIVDASYIEIAGLELDGRGLAVDGVKAESNSRFAHDITLDDLLIKGHGADQQVIGISTKSPAWKWVIRNTVILEAGTGMYLGESDGSAPFVAGLIEGNLIRDTRGYNLQIKHQLERPALPGMPAQPSTTIIRHNVFSKQKNGSREALARPNLLVGHFPKSGAGSEDIYLIYANFLYENPTEALFQGEGNIALYSNVFVNMSGSAVHIQPHNGRPESVDVFGNTVVARDRGILIVGGNPDRSQRAFGNAIFADAPLEAPHASSNVIGNLQEAAQRLRSPFASPGALELAPLHDSAVKTKAWPSVPGRYVDAAKDFEGNPRVPGIAGAYSSRAPIWSLPLDRKPR